jgi:hypothetical protein
MDQIEDDRTRKEQEYVRLRQESEEVMHELFCILEKHKEKDPVGLLEWACHAVLGRDDETPNTFLALMRLEDDGVDTTKRLYGDFAELILNELPRKHDAIQERPYSLGGFVPFTKIIEKNFSINKFRILNIDLSWPSGTAPAAYRCRSVIGRFFEAFAYDLAIAIDLACRVIYEGVPLYERSCGNGGYVLLSDNDQNIYIEKKGELIESGEITEIPSWAKNLFVKEYDVQMHSVFFKSGSYDSSPEEILIRRKALRDAIGVPDRRAVPEESELKAEYRGELMKLALQIQDRFWNESRFDIVDPETYPKQSDIIDWIKRQKSGISDAEARAVEKVACPIKR